MHKICLATFLVQLLLHHHHRRQRDQQQKVLKFQLESFWRLQLGQTTACSGLQEKLCGMPWLKMMILPLMFAFREKNILRLRIKFANFMFIYATNHYGPFLFEYPKISYLACPHALQIQITFYPFIMI